MNGCKIPLACRVEMGPGSSSLIPSSMSTSRYFAVEDPTTKNSPSVNIKIGTFFILDLYKRKISQLILIFPFWSFLRWRDTL